jgi:hypothetical protein
MASDLDHVQHPNVSMSEEKEPSRHYSHFESKTSSPKQAGISSPKQA